MFLVIKKFEPGGKTTQPRLYKRGNDDIDLDAYIRDAESSFGFWLATSGLKDAQKREVLAAYQDILQGINNGTFTYKLGGGYDNTVGVTNKTKGFDAYGLAAGYLGNVLRSQSVYSPASNNPEADASKISWTGNSSIGKVVLRGIYGGDTENIKDFIGLDPFENNTRATTNRSAEMARRLQYVKDNFDNLYTSYTDNDKAQAMEWIDLALGALADGTLSENEYLTLSRATGISNLRDMFFAGQLKGPLFGNSNVTEPYVASPPAAITEEQWIAEHYPRKTVTLSAPLSLNNSTKYGSWNRTQFDNYIKSLDDRELIATLSVYLRSNSGGRSLSTVPSIARYYQRNPNAVQLNDQYMLNRILNILYERPSFAKYADGNFIYIPNTYSQRRGTGLVWDMSSNTINELSIHDILFWKNRMHNEYISQVPSNKKGGVLRKLVTGGVADWNSVARYSLQDPLLNTRFAYNGNTSEWSQRTARSKNTIAPENKQYDSEGDVTDMQASDMFQNWVGDLTSNEELAKYWAENYLANHDDTKIANFWRNQWYTDGLFDFEKFKTAKGENGEFLWADNLGGVGHDRYAKSVWLDPEGLYHSELALGYEADGDWTFDPERFLYIRQMKATNPATSLEDVDPNNPLAVRRMVVNSRPAKGIPDLLLDMMTPDKDHVDETQLSGIHNDSSVKAPSIWGDAAADLLGAGRLGWSLHANKRVRDTVLPSLNPVLKDTYERYSPVTGALGEMQFFNSRGADVLSAAERPYTSDASLNAARMLDGQRLANDLQTQGFLANNKEIKRTQNEALLRTEDNMARRSDVANFNRASINQTNRERAQLEASKIKSDWQSVDNYLGGVESRVRERIGENRERINNLADKVVQGRAESWLMEQMAPMEAALRAWQSDPLNQSKPITDWPEYEDYKRVKQLILQTADSMVYQDMSRRYNLVYNNPYTKYYNAGSIWDHRNVIWKKGNG